MTGVEPSPLSCAKAQELYGIEVQQGTMNRFEARGREFELVTIMGNLQLHENPFATLRQCYDVMADEGLLIYEMKNPESIARLLAVAATQVPGVRDWKTTRLVVERGFSCMRFAASKAYLAAVTEELGFEVLEVMTVPPRMLAYGQSNQAHRKGWKGIVWQLLDRVDQLRDEQAWIRVCARKRVTQRIPPMA